MDKTHNAKGLCHTSTPLFKISTHDTGPKNKTQFHVMFDDNFDTVQSPDPNIRHTDKMDFLLKTNIYKYDDPFGNKHTYLFSHGGVYIHPDNLTPNIETFQ
jgi:hypothetical protein